MSDDANSRLGVLLSDASVRHDVMLEIFRTTATNRCFEELLIWLHVVGLGFASALSRHVSERSRATTIDCYGR